MLRRPFESSLDAVVDMIINGERHSQFLLVRVRSRSSAGSVISVEQYDHWIWRMIQGLGPVDLRPEFDHARGIDRVAAGENCIAAPVREFVELAIDDR